MVRRLPMLIACGMVAACAQHAHEVAPQYVSTHDYDDYTCAEMEDELVDVTAHARMLGAQIDNQADRDTAMVAVSVVAFWPAMFFVEGDTYATAEYARLRGEADALDRAMHAADC